MQESRTITRKSASNLALAFVVLPREKRDAMSALYAFCREVDDVADEEAEPAEARRARLTQWRNDLRRCYEGKTPEMGINRELQPVVSQYGLKFEHFDDLLRGVEMDLSITRYADYDALELYCYRVASVVGLLSIEIFGYSNPGCQSYAVQLGKALQFTNILRDVGTDARRGRIYLPQSELKRFGVQEEQILSGQHTPAFEALARDAAERARRFYRGARESLPSEDRRSMVAAELMAAVYWRLLQKVEHSRFDVLGPVPARLNRPHKLLLVGLAWLRLATRLGRPEYGR